MPEFTWLNAGIGFMYSFSTPCKTAVVSSNKQILHQF